MTVVHRSGIEVSHRLVPRPDEVVTVVRGKTIRVPVERQGYDTRITDRVTTRPPVPPEEATKALGAAGLSDVTVSAAPGFAEEDGVLDVLFVHPHAYTGRDSDGPGYYVALYGEPVERAVQIIDGIQQVR